MLEPHTTTSADRDVRRIARTGPTLRAASLWWILRCYVSRPIIWALIVLSIIVFISDFAMSLVPSNFQRAYPQPPPAKLDIYSPELVQQTLAAGRAADVDSIRLSSLWFRTLNGPPERIPPGKTPPAPRAATKQEAAGPEEQFYRVLDDFPNLRQVEYTGFGKNTGFDRVVRVPGLEYLTLSGVEPLDLAPLEQSRNLRWLDLQTSKPPKNLGALARLPHLETIVVSSWMAIDDQLLAEIARLPDLKTLVLDFSYYYPFQPPRLTAAGFAQLKQSPALTEVFVAGRPEGRELLAMARTALPQFNVRPALARPRIWGVGLLHILPFVGLATAIGVQLSSQMRSPLRRVAPGFTGLHYTVGMVLCALLTGLAAWRLIATGALASAAWGTAAALVLSVAGAMTLTSLGTAIPNRKITRLSLIFSAVNLGVMGIMIAPEISDSLLLEGNASLLAGVWVGAIVCAALQAWMLSRLVYWSTSASDRVLGSGRSQPGLYASYREGWFLPTYKPEACIERWQSLRPEDWTWWRRVTRRRTGNPPARIVPFSLVMVIAMVGIQALVLRNTRPGSFTLSGGLCFAAMMILGIGTMQVTVVWWTRMATLPLEMTRPVARRNLSWEWIVAVLLDLLPNVTIASAVAAVGLSLVGETDRRMLDGRSVVMHFFFLLPIAAIAAAGLGAMALVIERVWLAIVLAAGFLWVMPLAVVGAAFVRGSMIEQPASNNITPLDLEVQLWIPALFGALLAAFAVRRFLRMEVGRRA